MFVAPSVIATEVFTSRPEALRKNAIADWLRVQKRGAKRHSLLESPSMTEADTGHVLRARIPYPGGPMPCSLF